MTNHASPAVRPWFLSIRGAATTMVVFLVLNLGPLVQCCREMSRFDVFTSVQIGMSQSEAREVLSRNGVVCNLTRGPNGADCLFSDFWREYGIRVDPADKTVTSKYFRFRRTPRELLSLGLPR